MRGIAFSVLLVSALVGGLSGCGSSPSTGTCELTTVLNVEPTSATADHAAVPPGNQVQFKGGGYFTAPSGCGAPALAFAADAVWTNPDPNDITISSAADATNGTAVCENATGGPVALSGTYTSVPGLTGTVVRIVQLTCR